ncbi:hypothetical protein KR51_00026190 [Rubidibacter lacunae KORDI 51-2]|uniref:Uncharacterized protein n=1 Tax=Rubidibacter lacunae KORDI 51-2 TaxID=582515 RepID=U5DIS9_9CHRO|nr:hypothetical protein [Rubidibacter lacunae]ERN40837.1 hypothetical protein KR51_00026190 [Rubidibacter lacunae KORDI 51-2]
MSPPTHQSGSPQPDESQSELLPAPVRPQSPKPNATPPQHLQPPTAPSKPVAPTPPRPAPPSAATPPTGDGDTADTLVTSARKHPIPPPSSPKQFRAIGLLRGRYQPEPDGLTRGSLFVSDGEEEQEVKSVLLGRTISVVKNHLNLEQPHLWVVYPRTRQREGDLHVQIVGVWEPETLKPDLAESETEPTSDAIESGYFSVRGEVVYYAEDKNKIVVSIRQTARQPSDKPKLFKLELYGTLAQANARGRFWDFQVAFQNNQLVVREATCIGAMPPKKPGTKKSRPPHHGPHRDGDSRSTARLPELADNRSTAGQRVPKPIKRTGTDC